MNVIGILLLLLGLISVLAAAVFFYYTLINLLILRSTLEHRLMAAGALLSIPTTIIVTAGLILPGAALFWSAGLFIWLASLSCILAGGILRMTEIRRVHEIPFFNIFFMFHHAKYYLAGIVLFVLYGISAHVPILRLTPGEVGWLGVAVTGTWAFGAVTLAVAEGTVNSHLQTSSVTATSRKRDFLLREDLIATRAYTDLTNAFLTCATPALSTKIVHAVLTEWAEGHPVLFEDSQAEEGGKINARGVTKNLERLYGPRKLPIVLEEFSALLSKFVDLYSAVTSSAHVNETLARCYKAVKKQYGDTPVIFDILRTMPAGILEEERLSLLSKEELEARARERTKELARTLLEMKKEKRFLESIVDTVPDSLLVLDANLKIKSANRSFYERFQTEPEKVIDSSITDILGDEEGSLSKKMGNVIKSGEMLENFELHLHLDTLGERIFNIAARKIMIGEELLVIQDITERKKAEAQIKASLREKEVLLQEIHHRVKNNLQIIYSSLHLRSGYVKDEQALEVFADCKSRIRSIALIHERLYQSEDLARVDFAEYTQRLAADLFMLYPVSSTVVTLTQEIKEAFLDVNAAVPCGLIIHELLANALKHAFPGGKGGEIHITMHPLKEKSEMVLIVRDNGVGLPEDVDSLKANTRGLQLVYELVDQLNGTIELERHGGTTFTITFPLVAGQ